MAQISTRTPRCETGPFIAGAILKVSLAEDSNLYKYSNNMIDFFLLFSDDLVTLSLKHSDGLSRTRSFYRKQSVTTMSVKKDSQCLQLIYQVVSLPCNTL